MTDVMQWPKSVDEKLAELEARLAAVEDWTQAMDQVSADAVANLSTGGQS